MWLYVYRIRSKDKGIRAFDLINWLIEMTWNILTTVQVKLVTYWHWNLLKELKLWCGGSPLSSFPFDITKINSKPDLVQGCRINVGVVEFIEYPRVWCNNLILIDWSLNEFNVILENQNIGNYSKLSHALRKTDRHSTGTRLGIHHLKKWNKIK